jgi:hypothetical protein
MARNDQEPDDALYDKAAEIAIKHLSAALEEGADDQPLVAIMMIEAAVNAAADATSPEDVVRLLRDLVSQIEDDIEDEE